MTLRLALFMLFSVAIGIPSATHADTGLMQLAQAKNDELASLRRRVALDPGNADLRFRLAKELARSNEYAESTRIFRQLIGGQPNDADYHLGLGQALLWSGKPRDALEPLQTAVRLAPGYEDAQRALGQALSGAGRQTEARQHWVQAGKRFPKAKWPGEALAEAKSPVISAPVLASTAKPPEKIPPGESASPVTTSASVIPATESTVAATSAITSPVFVAPPVSSTLSAPPSLVSPSRTRIEAGLGRERLSNGSTHWTEEFVVLTHDTAGRAQTISAKLSQTERFGLKDTTATFGGSARLSKDVVGTVEFGVSPTHRVLARQSIQGGLSLALQDGFGIAATFRQIDYNSTRLRGADFTAERYVGNYRVAYSVHPSRSSTAGNALGHRLQLGRFYGDDNQVQVLLAGGNEVDRPEVGIINQSQVRAIALFGRHWLTPYWAIAYAASHTRQEQTRRDGFTISLIGRL